MKTIRVVCKRLASRIFDAFERTILGNDVLHSGAGRFVFNQVAHATAKFAEVLAGVQKDIVE